MRRKHTIAYQKAARRREKQHQAREKRRIDALVQLGFETYEKYIRSEFWRSIRSRVFEAKGKVCVRCRKEAVQVHHARYDMRTLKGESIEHLHPVCFRCHEYAEYGPRLLTEWGLSQLRRANLRLGVP